jgi:hypothetical protein
MLYKHTMIGNVLTGFPVATVTTINSNALQKSTFILRLFLKKETAGKVKDFIVTPLGSLSDVCYVVAICSP